MLLSFFTVFFLIVGRVCSTGPEQIHLAATTDASTVIVSWASPESCNNDTKVYYGLTESSLNTVSKNGGCEIWDDESNTQGLHYIHSITLSNLTQRTLYFYKVSSNGQLLVCLFVCFFLVFFLLTKCMHNCQKNKIK